MKSLIPILVFACITVGFAQEGWLVPFAVAYQPDVSGFNDRFTLNSIPGAGTRHYGWGVELRSSVNGFLVGPMFFRTWDETANDSFQLRTDASGIFGEVGFKIAPFSFLTLVPMVGAGGMSQSFSIRAQTPDLELGELLLDPGQNAVLSSGMKLTGLAALEIGLSAATGGGRYGISLRAGYLYSPFAIDWHLSNGAEVSDTPDSKLGGLFFSAGLLIMPAPQVSSSTGGGF